MLALSPEQQKITDNAISELSTIRDFLRWSVSLFSQEQLTFGHGTDTAWDEAVNLVLATLNLPLDMDHTILDAKLLSHEKQALTDMISKRAFGKIPVPYLTHEAWFAGFSFYVDERVIIPRSPIAELIDDEFSPWVEREGVTRILDLCTGSGCIAIACAMAFEDAIVDAVDLSTDALSVAKINVDAFGLDDRVNLIQADVYGAEDITLYDIIVTNPPYVAQSEYDELPQEFMKEPKNALYADKEGLEVVHKILKGAASHLHPKGILVCEVGFTQEILENTYPLIPFTWLQFEKGGEGVFLLTCEELKEHQAYIDSIEL